MSTNKNFLIKSFSWVALANIITKPLWAVLFILAARFLGTESFGIYSYTFSLVLLMQIFFDFGLDYVTVRDTSRNLSSVSEYFNQVLLIRISFLLFFLVASVLYGYLYSALNSLEFKIFILLLFFQVTTVLLTFFKAVVSVFHNFKLFSIMLLIEKLSVIIFGFLSLIIFNKLEYFVGALLIANLINCIAFFIKIKSKYDLISKMPSLNGVVRLLKITAPVLLINIFVTIYFRTDIIILEYLTDDKHIVGIYGSIHRLIEMYLLIPTIIMSTAYPIINRHLLENLDFVINFVKKILNVLIIISLPAAIIISFNSYEINLLLFGKQYEEGYEGLMYIIWAIVPMGINFLFGNLLISVHRQKFSAGVLAIASFVVITLNFLLIPHFSFKASSIIAIMAEIIVLAIYTSIILKEFKGIDLYTFYGKLIVIIAANFLIFYLYLALTEYNLLSCVLILAVSDFILLYFTGIWSKNDIKNIMSIRQKTAEE